MPDFKQEMDKVMMLVQLAGTLEIDLDFLRNTHAQSETMGPLLEPTLWLQKGAKNLEDQKEVLRIAVPFIHDSRRIIEKHGARR